MAKKNKKPEKNDTFRCIECGGVVRHTPADPLVDKRDLGGGVVLSIPESVLIQKCDRCGETYWGDDSAWVDEAVRTFHACGWKVGDLVVHTTMLASPGLRLLGVVEAIDHTDTTIPRVVVRFWHPGAWAGGGDPTCFSIPRAYVVGDPHITRDLSSEETLHAAVLSARAAVWGR